MQYSNISKKDNIFGYVDADRYIYIHNEDTYLTPIKIELPEPPPMEQITGFGLPPEQQVFQYEKMPESLAKLESEVEKNKRLAGDKTPVTLEELRQYLLDNRVRFADEIKWIRLQWYYRLNGKWVFINGKPHYLTGWYWFYLNYYTLNNGEKPEFRYYDWLWFIIQHYFYNDKKNTKGEETPYHTWLGTNVINPRQTGKTNKAASIILYEATMRKNFWVGIQGNSEDGGRKVFEDHVVFAFKRLPFFFMPMYAGTTDTKSGMLELKYNPLRQSRGASVKDTRKGLDSCILYATNAEQGFFDKYTLNLYYTDEVGKVKHIDIKSRHEAIKPTLTQSAGLIRKGYMLYTTTVEEVSPENVLIFENLCELSMYQNRDKVTGRTVTGLCTVFLPAHWGFTLHQDKFGYCDKEKALESIRAQREAYLMQKDVNGLADFIRKYPIDYKESFTPKADSEMFNRQAIIKRFQELKYNHDLRNGDFIRTDPNDPFSPVKFVEKEDGKFWVSYLPEDLGYEPNAKINVNGVFRPARQDRFVASADPFRYDTPKTSVKKLSDGGGAVFLLRDKTIDPDTKPVGEWVTHRIVCTYQRRPTGGDNISSKMEYVWDMINMTDYYGAMMFPEINVDDVWKKYQEFKREGYLLYDFEIQNGVVVMSKTPGFYTMKQKDKLFKGVLEYTDVHISRERHIEFCQDCLQIRGIDDMTFYDRFTAVAGALMGAEIVYRMIDVKGRIVNNKLYSVKHIWR